MFVSNVTIGNFIFIQCIEIPCFESYLRSLYKPQTLVKIHQGRWDTITTFSILLYYSTHLNEDPLGVAMPQPLESKFPPTFMVSHGFLCSMYSFMVDSSKQAYFPLDFRTRDTPSAVVLTNTDGSALFIYVHILSNTAILDLCEENMELN